MSDFDGLITDLRDGIAGRNGGLPMGFTRLNNHISIRKANNYLVGGFTGTGKTGLVDDAFVLNPVEYHLSHAGSTAIEVVYWSMERQKKFKLMKWISRKIFLDEGIILDVKRLMGWCAEADRIKPHEEEIFMRYREYIERLLSVIHIFDNSQDHNPTGFRNIMKDFFLARGTIRERYTDENGRVIPRLYTPNDPQKIIIIVKDHLGLIRKEKNLSSKKEIIDKVSEDDRYFRDFYGASNVHISQFNRDISNPTRLKNGDVEPMLEDFKDSGSTQEDADVVLSLFNPVRYRVVDPSGYDLTKLDRDNGNVKYRSIKILKNSYGTDGIRVGMAFQGALGMFKEMPKRDVITDEHYNSITDNTYFLPHNH